LGVKPRWNTSSILGTLLIAAFAYIGSLYVNRYRLVDDGKKRIDTITGRVWELKTRQVFDEEKAKRHVNRLRREEPEKYAGQSDAEFLESLRLYNEDRDLQPHHGGLYSRRPETYWEAVKE
jgi:predicted outer membrane lipoprotein